MLYLRQTPVVLGSLDALCAYSLGAGFPRHACLIVQFMRHFRISAYPRPPPAATMSVTMRGTDVLEPGSVLLQDGTWLTAPVRRASEHAAIPAVSCRPHLQRSSFLRRQHHHTLVCSWSVEANVSEASQAFTSRQFMQQSAAHPQAVQSVSTCTCSALLAVTQFSLQTLDSLHNVCLDRCACGRPRPATSARSTSPWSMAPTHPSPPGGSTSTGTRCGGYTGHERGASPVVRRLDVASECIIMTPAAHATLVEPVDGPIQSLELPPRASQIHLAKHHAEACCSAVCTERVRDDAARGVLQVRADPACAYCPTDHLHGRAACRMPFCPVRF